jgi:hypothetical protein
MRNFLSLITIAFLFILIAIASTVQASDHQDSSNTQNDPIADLVDLYAFVDPHCASVGGQGCEADPIELILALTINPSATGAERFSEQVIYHFYFENDAGEESQIDCTFSVDQIVTCGGMGGLSVTARVGEIGVNGDIRVYAGLRDDPFFWDGEAQERFEQLGIAAYVEPGKDTLAGSNVLAIVVGIKITAMSGGTVPNHNVQKIWAASERIAGDGINGAISGSWYNPDQNGQGWVIEVGGTPSDNIQFLSYFYGYDNNDEQLWLISGSAIIDGATVTAQVYRTSGSGFGGDFDPSKFALGDVVGSMTFEFNHCDSGTVYFVSADMATLPDFTTDITRITNIHSLDCNLLLAGQVDRVGRPLVKGMIPEEMLNSYNANSDPDTWDAAYSASILTSLQMFGLANGQPGYQGFYTQEQWAPVFADDRVQIDIKKAQSVGFMTIERAKIEGIEYEDGSGRALDYDIHENLFNVLITSFDPFVDDFVDGNDVPYLDDFPFLAPPH